MFCSTVSSFVTQSPNATRQELLSLPSYRWLLLSLALTAIGNGMAFIASAWLTLELGKRGLAVGALLLIESLPGLLIAPFAGVFIDRYDRRKVLVVTNIAQALLTMGIPVLHWLGHLEVWHVFVLAFCAGTVDTMLWPTQSALVREIVPPRLLLHANATTRAAIQTGMIVGGGLGGVLIAATHPTVALVLDAISFLACAACLLFVTQRPHRSPEKPAQDARQKPSFQKEFLAGLGFVRHNPALLLPYLTTLTLWGTVRVINTLLPSYAKDALGGGATAFGFIDAAWAVGSVVGALLVANTVARFGTHVGMVGGMLLQACGLFAVALAPNVVAAMLAYAVMGFGQNAQILFRTRAQELTPNTHQGRVEGVFSVLSNLIGLGLYLGVGFLLESTGTRAVYAFQGALIFLAGLLVWRVLSEGSAQNAGV